MTRLHMRDCHRYLLLSLALAVSWTGVARAADTPEPELSLGVVSTSAGLYRGWPLVLSIGVVHPDGVRARLAGESVTPISIEVPTGRKWSELVKLVVRNAQGQLQPWPFLLLTQVGTTLTLDAAQAGHLVVVLPPEATASLPAGQYSVRAWLDSREGSTFTSFKGWATSGAELVLQNEPATLTPELHCARGHVFSRYHRARGNTAQAVAVLDAALAQAPEDILCLTARGDMADSLGQTKQAIDFYHRAISARFKQTSAQADNEGDSGVLFAACGALMSKLPAADRDPLSTCGYKGVCTAETDAELCTRAGAECGQASVTDRCGVARTVSCGTCTSPESCGGGGTANACGCASETDAAFCARQGKSCGTVTGQDNCGVTRTVASCGTCASPQSCGGGGIPNVCGCQDTNPAICARMGRNCGDFFVSADACGQLHYVSCGPCPWPQSCGGGGTPYVCGCTSESDAEFCSSKGASCGSITGLDRCGQARTVASCGTCTEPYSCGGGGTANRCGECRPGDSCDGWSPAAPAAFSAWYPVQGTAAAMDDVGRPHIAASLAENDVSGGRIQVMRVEAGQWLQLGEVSARTANLTQADARNPSMDVQGSTVAVAFSDLNVEGMRRIYVAGREGGSWRLYDSSFSTDFNSFAADNPSVALNASGHPAVAWREASYEGGPWLVYARRWTGSNWNWMGGAASSGTGTASPPSIAVSSTGEVFVAWASNNQSVYVSRWNGSSWVRLGTGSISSGGNALQVQPPSLILDGSGQPVVAWSYCIASSSSASCPSRIIARRWNGSAWETLGAPLGGSVDASAHTGKPSLALDGAGRLGMAWDEGYNMEQYPFVYRWSGTTWGLVDALTPLARSKPQDVQLMFGTQGRPVLAFTVAGGSRMYVYQR